MCVCVCVSIRRLPHQDTVHAGAIFELHEALVALEVFPAAGADDDLSHSAQRERVRVQCVVGSSGASSSVCVLRINGRRAKCLCVGCVVYACAPR